MEHLKKTHIENPRYKLWLWGNLGFLVLALFGVPFALTWKEYSKNHFLDTHQYLMIQGIFFAGVMPFLIIPLNIIKRVTFYETEFVIETIRGIRKYKYNRIDYVSREFSQSGYFLKLKLKWRIFGYSLFLDAVQLEDVMVFLKRKKVRIFRNIWDGLKYEQK